MAKVAHSAENFSKYILAANQGLHFRSHSAAAKDNEIGPHGILNPTSKDSTNKLASTFQVIMKIKKFKPPQNIKVQNVTDQSLINTA